MFDRIKLAGVTACLVAVLTVIHAGAAETELSLPLDQAAQVEAHNVTIRAIEYRGGPALEIRRIVSGAAPDIDTFAFVPGFDFHNGTIEVEVAGSPLPDAPPGARGFVGVVFRVQTADGTFACEGIYLRPTNGRADDQVRRNHSTQYFAYPGYDFARLRREAPAQYESYVDLIPGEWTAMRIEVNGTTAKLFVGGAPQPALIVNDLKRGADAHGSIGLYVDNGTDGHFRKMRVRPTS
ncbi:family 16 glycoside hydrolase [Bradyrhizobium sp. LTSPM299]|uniref:family 16 glycoside hydrolase n=1 Tax=Bradyrhizobium sp. LTSPM299 TaxID=1619233 RepID=UPI0006787452